MTGVTCVLVGGGTPNYLGSVTVTVGTFSVPNVTRYGSEPPNYGSITPATWADSGLTISGLYYNTVTVTSPTAYAVVMRITGYAPNVGWSTLTIAGYAYSRVDASYSYDGTYSSWVWSTTTTNPFGTTIGATKAVVWS